jgi:hypothetical protein
MRLHDAMHRHAAGLVMLVIAQGACGGRPAPTAPASASAAPAVVAVFVQAPPGVSANDQVVGQETQLSASVRFADGRVKSGATTQISWASSTPSVAAVSPSGVMRIVSAGEAEVSAMFEGVSGRAHVYAWPGDRVELRGTIRSSSGAPIAGARVTTTSNFRFPRAETTSDADGRFRLGGIDQPTAFGDIVAIHDDYDVASVPFRPDQLATGIDVVLQSSPDRVYARVRGSNMCAEHPFDVLHVGGLTMATRRAAGRQPL